MTNSAWFIFGFVFIISTILIHSQSINTGDLIVNGDFEQFTRNITANFEAYTVGDNGSFPWVPVSGEQGPVASSFWSPYTGNYSYELNQNGVVAQTLNIVGPGNGSLTFALAGNPAQPGFTMVKVLQVTVQTVNATVFQQNFTFDITGLNTTNMGWILQNVQFQTLEGNQTYSLIFQNEQDEVAGPCIDAVSLFTTISSPSPTPSTSPSISPSSAASISSSSAPSISSSSAASISSSSAASISSSSAPSISSSSAASATSSSAPSPSSVGGGGNQGNSFSPSLVPSYSYSATVAPTVCSTPTPSPTCGVDTPTPSGCATATPSPSSCSGSNDDDDGVTINFYFADILNGLGA